MGHRAGRGPGDSDGPTGAPRPRRTTAPRLPRLLLPLAVLLGLAGDATSKVHLQHLQHEARQHHHHRGGRSAQRGPWTHREAPDLLGRGETTAFLRAPEWLGPGEAAALREEVRGMFYWAYDNYLDHAFPADELKPLSCRGVDTLGGYSLTLVDALDTLVVLGNRTEFARQVKWVGENLNFNRNKTISVFETNIRVLGGLLSAHLLATDEALGFELEEYEDELLDLAEDLARRMLPAFETPTGIPFGSANLKYGVPGNESHVTSTACAGTLALEFGILSHLTGDSQFKQLALRAAKAIWSRRSKLGLVGGHIDIFTGKWTHKDAGVGTSIDSFYEYLLKAYVLLGDQEYHHMFCQAYASAEQHLRSDPWYVEVNMDSGILVWPVFNSLQAFWPGLQAQVGDITKASRTQRAFMGIWEKYGFTPETFSLPMKEVAVGHESYPLRPELMESAYHLYRITGDNEFLQMGRSFVESLRKTRTHCGHAMIDNVVNTTMEDSMESFFLSETLKYLYLLFDAGAGGDSPFNQQTQNYVFTTEGHVIPVYRNISSLLHFYPTNNATGPRSKFVAPALRNGSLAARAGAPGLGAHPSTAQAVEALGAPAGGGGRALGAVGALADGGKEALSLDAATGLATSINPRAAAATTTPMDATAFPAALPRMDNFPYYRVRCAAKHKAVEKQKPDQRVEVTTAFKASKFFVDIKLPPTLDESFKDGVLEEAQAWARQTFGIISEGIAGPGETRMTVKRKGNMVRLVFSKSGEGKSTCALRSLETEFARRQPACPAFELLTPTPEMLADGAGRGAEAPRGGPGEKAKTRRAPAVDAAGRPAGPGEAAEL